MFANPPHCHFKPMMGNLNNWIFCGVRPTDKFQRDKMNSIFQSALTHKSNEVMSKIKEGGFGAVASDDDSVADGFFRARSTLAAARAQMLLPALRHWTSSDLGPA